MKNINTILIICFTFLLASCSSLNSNFDCPMQACVMCKSMDEINGMVDSGELPYRRDCSQKISCTPEFQPYAITSGFYPGAPLRYGETVQRIWVAPFEDAEKNYHQDSYMYAIIKDGHWIGRPVTSQLDS